MRSRSSMYARSATNRLEGAPSLAGLEGTAAIGNG